MVPGSEDAMARKQTDPNAEIMSRLNATGLLPALEAAKTTSRITGARRTSGRGSGTRRGMLRTETTDRRFMIHGRRAMSPWQARALGSGEGVVVNPDTMSWTNSPQDWRIGWSASYVTYPGRETIDQGKLSGAVHVSFPEWVQ